MQKRLKVRAHFYGDLDLRFISEHHWVLQKPYYFKRSNGHIVTLPRDMPTDLASIPRVLQSLIPKIGKHTRAAVIHDGGYRGHATVYGPYGHVQDYTRHEWDRVLMEGMKVSGEPFIQRWLIYGGVRLGGWVSYRKS